MPNGERTLNADRAAVVRGMRAAWWVLWPAFTALTVRLGVERGCGDPYDLLPAIVSNPTWAWPLALGYVAAHAWIAAVYLVTVADAGRLAPGWRAWQSVWRGDLPMVALMIASMALEYAPVSLWRLLAAAAGCGR